MGARFAENGAFYIYSVFVLVYATQHVKMDRSSRALNAMLSPRRVELMAIPFFGALSDRIGRRPVYLFGAVMTALFGVSAVLAARHGLAAARAARARRGVHVLARADVRPAGSVFLRAVRHARALQRRIARRTAGVGPRGRLSPFIATLLLARYGATRCRST